MSTTRRIGVALVAMPALVLAAVGWTAGAADDARPSSRESRAGVSSAHAPLEATPARAAIRIRDGAGGRVRLSREQTASASPASVVASPSAWSTAIVEARPPTTARTDLHVRPRGPPLLLQH